MRKVCVKTTNETVNLELTRDELELLAWAWRKFDYIDIVQARKSKEIKLQSRTIRHVFDFLDYQLYKAVQTMNWR